jgi:catechol 2,3-dioxygenase-like lactoylglutathione lyase family enzyme
MLDAYPLTGIHHVTMIASDPQANIDFYTGVLGMRLVKLTVNFDAPNVYHLYYGDGLGTPGTLLTFFPFPNATRGRQGIGQVNVVALGIPPSSLGFWIERLLAQRISYQGPTRRGDESVLTFRDPDGLALELQTVPNDEMPLPAAWERSAVPIEHQIRGIAGVTAWYADASPTTTLLTDTLGFAQPHALADRARFKTPAGTGSFDVRSVGGFWGGEVSAGTVHHVAWRVADDAGQEIWRERLSALNLDPTPVQDRQYFRSIYFREPGGVLFEIATDPPGFTIDETPDTLGTSLKLPSWWESSRTVLEDILPKVQLPDVATGDG